MNRQIPLERLTMDGLSFNERFEPANTARSTVPTYTNVTDNVLRRYASPRDVIGKDFVSETPAITSSLTGDAFHFLSGKVGGRRS
jgi:hypothetical protein